MTPSLDDPALDDPGDSIRKWMIFENPWWIRKIEILFILLMEYSD